MEHRRFKPLCKDKKSQPNKEIMEVSWENMQHEQRAKAQRREKSQAHRE